LHICKLYCIETTSSSRRFANIGPISRNKIYRESGLQIRSLFFL